VSAAATIDPAAVPSLPLDERADPDWIRVRRRPLRVGTRDRAGAARYTQCQRSSRQGVGRGGGRMTAYTPHNALTIA